MRKMSQTTRNFDRLMKRITHLAIPLPFSDSALRFPLYATWDDHDYGLNDAGEEFRHKAASERLFETFWKIPSSDPSVARPGVYRAVSFGPVGKRVQLILLDTRSFRSGLERPLLPPAHGRYTPSSADAQSVLGTVQWSWLQKNSLNPLTFG